MLTGDENIVEASFAVFWQIKDAGQYLFNVRDPENTVKVAAESAMREVIGRNPIQSALSEGREKIASTRPRSACRSCWIPTAPASSSSRFSCRRSTRRLR